MTEQSNSVDIRREIEFLNASSAKFEYTIERMKAGMPDDARGFLMYSARCISEGATLPQAFVDFLVSRLTEIAELPSPFGEPLLARDAGGGSRLKLFDMKHRVAEEMYLLRNNGGKKLHEAAEIVANRYNGNKAVPEWLRELTHERALACYAAFRPIFDGEEIESGAAKIVNAGSWATVIPPDDADIKKAVE